VITGTSRFPFSLVRKFRAGYKKALMSRPTIQSIAVYPGSFDPITLGHIDIIKRLAGHYREIIVIVAQAAAKTQLFSALERATLIRESLAQQENVRVDVVDGLTVDYARKIGASVIIRGLRAVADFEYEYAMANMNRKLAPDIETMIVFTRPEYSFVSSRMVKEVAFAGGQVEGLVPPPVVRALRGKVSESRGGK
jgi:pantetheine-phosphate adenylyltransferase